MVATIGLLMFYPLFNNLVCLKSPLQLEVIGHRTN